MFPTLAADDQKWVGFFFLMKVVYIRRRKRGTRHTERWRKREAEKDKEIGTGKSNLTSFLGQSFIIIAG